MRMAEQVGRYVASLKAALFQQPSAVAG